MFEQLTKYLDVLKPGNYGTFIEPTKDEKGTLVLHGFQYSKDVTKFEEEVYKFAEQNPQFQHTHYLEILKEHNIDANDSSIYLDEFKGCDTNLVFLILFSIIRSEHFCEGSIMNGLEKGNIQRCLEELKKRDYPYDASNVKEISIVSKFVFMMYNGYWYKDLLRLSEHWVSYKRNSFSKNKVVAEWSYKTKRTNRIWESITKEAIDVFQRDKPWMFMTDVGSFNIRVTFKNNEHWDLELSSNFAANELERLARMIKQMIPSEETDYPDVLDVIPLFLDEYPLTRKNLEELKKEDICALMYAEGGAMGCPGEVCIIDVNGRKYFNHGIYSDEECDISQIEVIDTYFEGFEHIDGIGAPDYKDCSINGESWKYINLGFGNHLFVRRDFWFEHGDRITNVDIGKRYTNWKRLIKERY